MGPRAHAREGALLPHRRPERAPRDDAGGARRPGRRRDVARGGRQACRRRPAAIRFAPGWTTSSCARARGADSPPRTWRSSSPRSRRRSGRGSSSRRSRRGAPTLANVLRGGLPFAALARRDPVHARDGALPPRAAVRRARDAPLLHPGPLRRRDARRGDPHALGDPVAARRRSTSARRGRSPGSRSRCRSSSWGLAHSEVREIAAPRRRLGARLALRARARAPRGATRSSAAPPRCSSSATACSPRGARWLVLGDAPARHRRDPPPGRVRRLARPPRHHAEPRPRSASSTAATSCTRSSAAAAPSSGAGSSRRALLAAGVFLSLELARLVGPHPLRRSGSATRRRSSRSRSTGRRGRSPGCRSSCSSLTFVPVPVSF